MKKFALLGALLLLTTALAACGGSGAGTKAAASNAQTVTQILESAAQDASASNTDGAPTVSPVPTEAVLQTPDADEINLSSADADIDLTLLSGTMVYSQVSQMIYTPDDYIGKTVKMEGTFAVYEGERQNYFACIVTDATACCANGIEFVLAGEHVYPDDYPEPGTEITVVGTFGFYEENDFLYIQLEDAQLTF